MNFDLIFLGIAGSGKGTQSKIIAEKMEAARFAVGEELRRIAATREDDLSAPDLDPVLKEGKLCPTEFVQKITTDFIARTPCDQPIVFDGAGRMMPEKVNLDQIYPRGKRGLKLLLLDLDVDAARQRIAERNEGRADDALEIFDTRIAEYERETKPVIDAFFAEDRGIRIDADQPLEKVTADIMTAIEL